MKRVIRENDNWRIVVRLSGDDEVLVKDYYYSGVRIRIRLGEVIAFLERKRGWFSTRWIREEITNIHQVIEEWKAKYFDEGTDGS